jgi:hypothetical protein
MSSPKFRPHENNTLKIDMSDNYENHSEDNWKVFDHFINTCYFNFYATKSKRSVRSLALTLTLDKIFTLGARARHQASKTRALHITGLYYSLFYVWMQNIMETSLRIKEWKWMKEENKYLSVASFSEISFYSMI